MNPPPELIVRTPPKETPSLVNLVVGSWRFRIPVWVEWGPSLEWNKDERGLPSLVVKKEMVERGLVRVMLSHKEAGKHVRQRGMCPGLVATGLANPLAEDMDRPTKGKWAIDYGRSNKIGQAVNKFGLLNTLNELNCEGQATDSEARGPVQ
ncbi:hypothetical protein F0562_033102 [Nyssa sinensis]|uniref:Uncharacterized protein n=1 Tax=Nyssa sinensis TaxID=561372 RepID=A0A5J5AQF4_9ASTE|nr:hypothetical protein F0562_033102 [Nyssa sinensis]